MLILVVSNFSIFLDDCIGIAVDLWSEVTVSRADKFEITAEGEGATEMPKDFSNYMVVGCKAAFEAAGKPLPTLKYHVVSRIPYARGLGSSSAAIVAGIVAGLVLAGHRLPCWGSEALLQLAAGIEVCPTMLQIDWQKWFVRMDGRLIKVSLPFFLLHFLGPSGQCGSRHLWRHSAWHLQRFSLDDGTCSLSSWPTDGHVHS